MWTIWFVTTAYLLAFVIGATGNLWVMTAMVRSKLFGSSPRSFTANERSRIFVFVLAVTDFLYLFTVPFSLYQILFIKWDFGQLTCRILAVVETGGKSFSVVILTVMSIERYLVVCTRWRYVTSPMLSTMSFVALGVGVCVVIPSIPQFVFTSLQPNFDENATGFVCLQQIPNSLIPSYLIYTFITGFALPLFIMAICYCALVRHVRRKFREQKLRKSPILGSMKSRPKYFGRMNKSICRIATVHFFCWAPYWFFQLWPLVAELFSIQFSPDGGGHIRLLANVLPCVNSAGNWILYAYLNRDVRKHILRSSSSRLRYTPTSPPIAGPQSATFSYYNNPASE